MRKCKLSVPLSRSGLAMELAALKQDSKVLPIRRRVRLDGAWRGYELLYRVALICFIASA